MMTRDDMERLLHDDAAAARELAEAATRFSAGVWSTPLTPGGWTAAQHVVHVALAHRGIVHDVRDGVRARLRGSPRQRGWWRIAGLSQVLWLRRLPGGAQAPREIVPPAESPPCAAAIQELEASVVELAAVMRQAMTRSPEHCVQHPYFGSITLRQTMVVSAVHTRHHAKLLRRAIRLTPDSVTDSPTASSR
jgi:hypothetical protein